MRDKHMHIAKDSELLKLIYHSVDEQLPKGSNAIRQLIRWKFVFYCTCTLLLYAGLYMIQNTALFIACFVLYGFASLLFAFNFAHDFSHNTVFKNKKWNNAGFVILYSMVGAHAEAWKHRHVSSHHYAPNVEHYDSDLEISGLIRVIPNSPHHWYHRWQHWYAPVAYTTYSLFWVFIKDFIILFSKEETPATKGFSYHVSFWLQKIFYIGYLLMLPILFSAHPWYMVLIAFLLMHLFQSAALLFTFFMTHHVESAWYPTVDENGYINSSWLMNQVKSSNDFYPFSPAANFIFGGFNNHIAHHLFPHIHHCYYPQLNRILYRILQEHKIEPNQTSYFGGMASHLRLLKRMSRV